MNRPGIILTAGLPAAFGIMAYLVFGAGIVVRNAESGKVTLAYDRVGGKLIVNGYVLEWQRPGGHQLLKRVVHAPDKRLYTVGAPQLVDGMGDTAFVQAPPRGAMVYAVYWIDCDEFGDEPRLIESDVRFILQCMKTSRAVAGNTGNGTVHELAMRTANLEP